jgi:hypothetical protein
MLAVDLVGGGAERVCACDDDLVLTRSRRQVGG